MVDSEVILGYLKQAGFLIVENAEGADVVIINTCSFIQEAQEESIDVILSASELKKEHKINKIVVCGCLTERYKQKLADELTEVDAFVGVAQIPQIATIIKSLSKGKSKLAKISSENFLYSHSSPRVRLTPSHFAYVKISEGCNHRCSYCVIPSLRGKHRSRPMASIIKETQELITKHKVREINLIGQDTTAYGKDLYGEVKIAQLLKALSSEAKSNWVRLLYTHPAYFSKQLIATIKEQDAICKYIDLPLQHINDKILTRMRRGTSSEQIRKLIECLRKEIPSVALRTVFIVGFPGETEKQFKQLLQFIKDVRFERLGLFKYSREKGSSAHDLSGQIPEKVKQARYEEALALQQEISTEVNQRFLGKKMRVLIDEIDSEDKNVFLARSEYDAPEVDGCVYVKSKKDLKVGSFVDVLINDTLEYDLVGEAK